VAFVKACSLSDVADGTALRVEVDGLDVAIVRQGDDVYAIEDECSHAETTLSDGILDGYTITCPLHMAQFDVRDGRHLCAPAFKGVPSFAVTEDGARVTIEVPATKRRDAGPGAPGGMFRTR
jgi:3-phenylpropionate/trans-cinnamate dioxygenase ferredoxin subunit